MTGAELELDGLRAELERAEGRLKSPVFEHDCAGGDPRDPDFTCEGDCEARWCAQQEAARDRLRRQVLELEAELARGAA